MTEIGSILAWNCFYYKYSFNIYIGNIALSLL